MQPHSILVIYNIHIICIQYLISVLYAQKVPKVDKVELAELHSRVELARGERLIDTFLAAYSTKSEESDKIMGRLYVTNQQLMFVRQKHVFFRIKLRNVVRAEKKGFGSGALDIFVYKSDVLSFNIIARDLAYNCITTQLKFDQSIEKLN